MERNPISGIVIAIVLVAGGWYLLRGTPASAPVAPEETSSPATAETATTTTGVTVTYGAQGFLPKEVTVPVGTTVTFVDQGTEKMWVASAVHPSHEGYDGTSKSQHCVADYSGPVPFDQCSAGANYSFTFLKAGVWKYHNHANAADTGTVTVVAAATTTPQ